MPRPALQQVGAARFVSISAFEDVVANPNIARAFKSDVSRAILTATTAERDWRNRVFRRLRI
jgi:hypothetical protein